MSHQPETNGGTTADCATDRFAWLERKGDDFPYYRGHPVDISGGHWLIIIFSVGIAFLVLIYTPNVFRGGILSLLPAILFVAIPLVTLASIAGNGWRALFRRMRWTDPLWIVAFFVINWIVTFIVGFIALTFLDAQANPASDTATTVDTFGKVLFFVKTAVQLVGEELLTILPFLALLWWLTDRGHLGRKSAVAIAALLASILFALVHLPTYGWNLPHTLVALVPVRIVLLLPYIMTKNLWVSAGVHILNDWMIFGLPLLLAAGDPAA